MLFYCCSQLSPLHLSSLSRRCCAIHCCRCHRVIIAPLLLLSYLPLPSPSSLLRHCCAVHCRCRCVNHRRPCRCCCHPAFHHHCYCCRCITAVPSIAVAFAPTITAIPNVVAATPSIAVAIIAVALLSCCPSPSPSR